MRDFGKMMTLSKSERMIGRGVLVLSARPGAREKHLAMPSVHVRLKAEMFGAKTPRPNNLLNAIIFFSLPRNALTLWPHVLKYVPDMFGIGSNAPALQPQEALRRDARQVSHAVV